MILAVDCWVIDRFQFGADWVHSMTGSDSIKQSRVMSAVTALGWLGAIVSQVNIDGHFSWVDSVLLLDSLYRAFFENEMDSAVRQSGKAGMRNPRRILSPLPFMRLFMLGLVGFSAGGGALFSVIHVHAFNFLFDALIVSVWVGMNLDACDVGGPRISKIRKFLNETLRPLNQQPVPVRE